MLHTNTQTFMWLRCMIFVTMLLNIVEISTLGWRTSTEVFLGFTPDISSFVHFGCWDKVYYLDGDGSRFPNYKKKLVCWCGPTENCGDALIYSIHIPDIKQMIARSLVRPDTDPNNI